MIVFLLLFVSIVAIEVYVSPIGSSGNSGLSPSAPVDNPTAAVAILGAMHAGKCSAAGMDIVHIAAGQYALANLTAECSTAFVCESQAAGACQFVPIDRLSPNDTE